MIRRLLLLLAFAPLAAPAEEAHPGVVNEDVTVNTADGVRLAGVLTRPEGTRRAPVIHFIQWLSCSTVMIRPEDQDGWSRMLRTLVRDSGYAVLRVDKRGVGGSDGGPCASLDFDTELADHRAALTALRQRDDVDTRRIVLFGGSMGSRYAPLMAAADPRGIAGVLVWGGGALTWFERMLGFDRNALELSGADPASVNARMTDVVRLQSRYLLEGRDPTEIFREQPELADVWKAMTGTGAGDHYGRPFAFHQQAQRADWAAAWSRIPVPVLAVQGELDWFESPAGGRTIERVAPAGRFVVVPGMNHHFSVFQNARQAFEERDGRVDPAPFFEVARPWLEERKGAHR